MRATFLIMLGSLALPSNLSLVQSQSPEMEPFFPSSSEGVSDTSFTTQIGDYTPVGAVGDYNFGFPSKDNDKIGNKVVTSGLVTDISTNKVRLLDSGKDRIVSSSLFSVGGYHTCVIDNSDTLYCWGRNEHGELGDGTNVNKNNPTLVNLGEGRIAAQLSAGGSHTCVIDNSDTLYCWGYNIDGQLGDGTNVNKNNPTLINLGEGGIAVQVFAGWLHTCAIDNSDTLYCWGRNEQGQLGDGTYVNKNSPTLINLGEGRIAAQVSAGWRHTCVIDNSDTLYCWGTNGEGQLGDGTYVNKNNPTLVNLGEGRIAAQLFAGDRHTCVIDNSDTLYCWGYNKYGQLGDGTNVNKNNPTLINLGEGGIAAQVSAGWIYTCAIDNSDTLYCWGRNLKGVLGDGTYGHKNSPTLINLGEGKSAAQVSAGALHTCAIDNSGTLYCWGSNVNGELGDGTNVNKLQATKIEIVVKQIVQKSDEPTSKPSNKPVVQKSDEPTSEKLDDTFTLRLCATSVRSV